MVPRFLSGRNPSERAERAERAGCGASTARPENLSPEVAIQSAVLHRLGDVRLGDLLSSRQVGDCTADFENPVVGPRREPPLVDRAFEQRLRPRAELAMLSYQSRRHLR